VPAKYPLTPEVAAIICAQVKRGNYVSTAAAMAGVPEQVVKDWLRWGTHGIQGKPAPRRYVEFTAAVRQAAAEAEVADLTVISDAARHHWAAAAWRLERRHPLRWGRTHERGDLADELDKLTEKGAQVVPVAGGGRRLTLSFDLEALSAGDLWQLRQIAQRAAAGYRAAVPASPVDMSDEPDDADPPVFLPGTNGTNGHAPTDGNGAGPQ